MCYFLRKMKLYIKEVLIVFFWKMLNTTVIVEVYKDTKTV